ncbi:MAG: glycerophosphodiester phosphodiesterase [Chloroflexi bacterium]|nr:glycerophosphodiester phosphodiesterase [Chloroflexota bacterium]
MNKTIVICMAALLLPACATAVISPAPSARPSPSPTGSKKPLNIAHRGARSLAPENTLAAALKAYEAGADMWELDVAVTADGQLVILHDDTLLRTSDAAQVFPLRAPWTASAFTLDELRQLDFGSWFNRTDPFKQIAAGAVSEQDQQSYVGAKIPTLREALEFTQDHHWRVNVEIKDASGTPGDAVVVQRTVSLIQELQMESSVMISSFNHAYLEQVRRLDPQMKTAALVDYSVPDPVALLEGLHAQGFNPDVKTIDLNQVPQLLQAGYEVYVWTVNDPATIRRLAQAGVTGIFTDFPQQFKKALAGGSD